MARTADRRFGDRRSELVVRRRGVGGERDGLRETEVGSPGRVVTGERIAEFVVEGHGTSLDSIVERARRVSRA